MFSAVVVDIESNILVLEGEASGCEVLTVEKYQILRVKL